MEIKSSENLQSTSNIKDINANEFMADVIEASSEKPIIVDFWAPWCEPCKQLTPLLENTVIKYKEKITLAKVNIDENKEIAAQLRIQSIPTVYTFYEGKVVDGFQGAKSNSEILDYVKKSASLCGPGEEVENLITMGKDAIEIRNWNEAGEIAQNILSVDPKNEEAFGFLIKSLIGLNKFVEVRELEEALEPDIKKSKVISEILLTIDVAEKAFKAKESLEGLKLKLEKDPDNLEYLLEIAVALFGNREIEASFEMLLKSIKIDKEWKEQAARKQLLEFFSSVGFDAKETISARRKLATLLF
ncbi:thioredoxin [bacterium]|nr:thioredoxin [bacterium]